MIYIFFSIIYYMSLLNYRFQRGINQELYLLQYIINKKNIKFNIVGTTKNVYTISINNKMTCCDCPDYLKNGIHCKHIYFVLHKILQFDLHNIYNNEYSYDQIVKYLSNHKNISIMADQDTINKYKKIKELKQNNNIRKPIKGDCPICLDNLNNGKKIIYCKYTCGNNIHEHCFNKWCEFKSKKECIYCRGDWEKKYELS